jgi:hypothetical protein
MATKNEFAKILNANPEVVSKSETITLTTPVRPSKNPEMFELFLGKLSSWIEVPVSVLTDVLELGVISDHNSNLKVVQIEIKRPQKDAFLFDLLENALIGIDDLNAEVMGCDCGCQQTPTEGSGIFKATKAASNGSSNNSGKSGGRRPIKRGTGGGTGGCCFFFAGKWWCPTCRS